MASRHRFRVDDEVRTVAVTENGDHLAVSIDDGDEVLVDVTSSGVPGQFSMIIDGAPVRAYVSRSGQTLRVTVEGRTFELAPVVGSGRSRGPMGASDPPGQIRAIAGVVVEVRVQVGGHISAGDTVAVIEAMKMQNEINAPMDGTVTVMHAVAGDRIEANDIVLEYEPDEAEDG